MKPSLDAVRQRIDPRWGPAEVEFALARTKRRARRRRLVRAGGAVAALLLVAGVGGSWWAREPRVETASTAPDATQVLRFADGSTAEAIDARSEVQIAQVSPALISLALKRGGGRFAVAHRPERVFRVEIEGVVVEVLGTQFTVTRGEHEVTVGVQTGRVLVRWADDSRVLGEGAEAVFPLAQTAAPDAAEASALPEAPAPLDEPRSTKKAPAWVDQARRGQFTRAFQSLGQVPLSERPQRAEHLLLASDAARLSGHPAEAVPYLRQILEKHPHDPRAPLAGFTLGRVFLTDLHDAAEAAVAFETTRRLAPTGSLAEDALAREVEAWSQAHQPERAQARANEYLRLYPEGRRAPAVRAFGGLK